MGNFQGVYPLEKDSMPQLDQATEAELNQNRASTSGRVNIRPSLIHTFIGDLTHQINADRFIRVPENPTEHKEIVNKGKYESVFASQQGVVGDLPQPQSQTLITHVERAYDFTEINDLPIEFITIKFDSELFTG